MPELPEVETTRAALDPLVRGRTVTSVRLDRPEVVARPNPGEFSDSVVGRRIVGTGRRGKFLMLLLDNGGKVVVHLRMTGCLLALPEDTPVERHTHAVLALDDGIEVRFTDPRRFGRIWLVRPGEEDDFTGISRLGPEPFDPAMTGEYLIGKAGASRRAVKECLMDQSVIAGLGNIYADESLFSAGINPGRPACTLSPEEWGHLAETVRERLSFFLRENLVSPEEFAATGGRDYRNTPLLRVYGHAGEPCPVCGEELRRTVIGGRGSVYCPSCQGELP